MAGPIPHDIQRLAYDIFDISSETITEADVSIWNEPGGHP